jgi:integrase
VKLKRANIEGPENALDLRISHTKNAQPVIIPLSSRAIRIFEKWEWKVPEPLTNQKHNLYLKEICAAAGIEKEVGTHTARRTFVTINLLRGVPARVIMSVTGHRSESQMFEYSGITFTQNADFMRNILRERGF